MTITHIMANGEVRESVSGVVIQSEQFYQVLRGIEERRLNKCKDTQSCGR